MNQSFESKVALITGAGSGIGRAVALAFAQQGATVIVSDISTEGGKETVAQIETAQGQTRFIQTDVTDPEAVSSLIGEIVQRYGKLDIAVNNAGIGGEQAPLGHYPLEDWHKVINVNLHSVFYCLQAELPVMSKQKSGAIVNISSIAGLRGLAYSSAYSASKHAVIGLSKSAALEYARRNIRVNAVCPVFTRTPLVEKMFERRADLEEKLVKNIPMKRYAQPEDIAQVIVWLCSDSAGFVTGQAMAVDGGLTAF